MVLIEMVEVVAKFDITASEKARKKDTVNKINDLLFKLTTIGSILSHFR